MTPHVLIVAGSDSSGGAGIARDVETVAALGLRTCVAVTAVTVQTHHAVSHVLPIEATLIEAQMRAALAANPVAAIKIGMLGTGTAIEAVAAVLMHHPGIPAILDPVLAASSGGRLLDANALGSLLRTLMPLCALTTPNLPELALLVGQSEARDIDTAVAQGALLLQRTASPSPPLSRSIMATPGLGPDPHGEGLQQTTNAAPPARAILVKGGHASHETSTDMLLRPARPPLRFDAPRLATAMRGTGCMLSSAIAARLARGETLPAAIGQAKQMVFERLAAAEADAAPLPAWGAIPR